MVSQTNHFEINALPPEFFVGGHPALDFINTISNRSDPAQAVDRLDNLKKILAWCVHLDLIENAQAHLFGHGWRYRKAEVGIVSKLSRLRDHGGDLFDDLAASGKIDPNDLGYVLSIAAETAGSLQHNPIAGQLFSPTGLQLDHPKQIVGVLALQILHALYTLSQDRLRSCPDCGWLFYDRSRGGRRKWCSMRDCGNRAKVNRHYQKHSTAGSDART